MSSNPPDQGGSDVDDGDGRFYVLLNEEGQHSLWPSLAEVPAGWRIIFGEESRRLCLEHVEAHWTELQPPRPRTAPAAERFSAAAT
ncbi:MbtH family protein [Streptomyces sp. NPDC090112]|uniref:MbtH family protein n=1 Tax=Streptomyces sp. NPDC090112 TaxID=3365949 RepID=UPI00380A02CF